VECGQKAGCFSSTSNRSYICTLTQAAQGRNPHFLTNLGRAASPCHTDNCRTSYTQSHAWCPTPHHQPLMLPASTQSVLPSPGCAPTGTGPGPHLSALVSFCSPLSASLYASQDRLMKPSIWAAWSPTQREGHHQRLLLVHRLPLLSPAGQQDSRHHSTAEHPSAQHVLKVQLVSHVPDSSQVDTHKQGVMQNAVGSADAPSAAPELPLAA